MPNINEQTNKTTKKKAIKEVSITIPNVTSKSDAEAERKDEMNQNIKEENKFKDTSCSIYTGNSSKEDH